MSPTLEQIKKMKPEEVLAMFAAQARASAITYKVGAKGGIVATGFGRFPITMYLSQCERWDADVENRKAFIAANRDKLAVKIK